MALIDLDHFKHVNDHYGHHVGDAVLKDFALAAVSVLRQTDVLARWGGEEFLLMMPNHSTHDDLIMQALDRIRLQLAALPTLPDNPVTFSAGVTCHPAGESLRETLERADRALYQAKANGRARTEVITQESDLEPQASPKHTSPSVVPQ
ncbi:MAG: GGDEF domain-containing protein [Aquabacterium sp.]|nr:GGDEF domain-containing protein [Aquabacterium sp.]